MSFSSKILTKRNQFLFGVFRNVFAQTKKSEIINKKRPDYNNYSLINNIIGPCCDLRPTFFYCMKYIPKTFSFTSKYITLIVVVLLFTVHQHV